jgi:UPF0176 protein
MRNPSPASLRSVRASLSRMRRLPIVTVLLLAVAGCATDSASPADSLLPTASTQEQAPPTTAPPAVPPPDATPARDGRCPYLETTFVAETNGQQVSAVRLSADEPPACFFYRGDGGEQLRVQVLTGSDAAMAKAMVDRVAPVQTSDPATVDGGWEGGRQPTDTGAVFAVAKGGAAVVVVTNQQQTIKAGRIAEQTITALGL